MKIWIDLANSPHINFFKPFISKWKSEGHELIITTRELANTIDLIEQNGWDYRKVGGHAGKNKYMKVLNFPRRVLLLRQYLRKLKPDIGISQSSYYSPIVGKLLGFPTIYLNDNEHATGNYLAFKFATLNMMPEFLEIKAGESGWSRKYKMHFYPGIKEGIYLSQMNINKTPGRKSHIGKDIIYIRPEPWKAHYYSGESRFLDDLIIRIKDKYKVIILPRGSEQASLYKSAKFRGVTVPDKPVSLEDIYKDCSLFIGAGGSMTRELAFLGVPTLCIYQNELLEVDKYLIKNQLMVYSGNPDIELIEKINGKSPETDNTLLTLKGKEAFSLINEKLIELSGTTTRRNQRAVMAGT